MASGRAFVLDSQADVPEFLGLDDYRELLFLCSKAQLLVLAEYFELNVSPTDKKGEILLRVIRATQGEDTGGGKTTRELEIESERLQIEKLKLEERAIERAHERERDQREEREKEKEREEREKERKHELEVIRLRGMKCDDRFDVNAAIKLVPSFQESDVEEFFLGFEKVARQLQWPQEMWTTLIQCKFVGKAQRVYVSLSEEVSKDYAQVKSLIMKAYALVPEAYRLKFRELRKQSSQTYVEFSRKQRTALEDWLRSKEVVEFDSFKELVLLEQFKNCMPKEIKIHLEESEVSTLEDAATKADEYALVHRIWHKPKERYDSFVGKGRGSESPPRKDEGGSPKKGSPQRNSNQSPPRLSGRNVQCFHCDERGHVRKYCPQLLKIKPVSLIGNLGSTVGSKQRDVWEDRGYEEHLYDGLVGLKPNEGRPVVLLRDTGASQSLILKGSLPEGFVNQGDDWVLLGGFPDTVTPSRLGEFCLSSDLIEGQVKLAIVDKMPVTGVDVVIANDLKKSVKLQVACAPIVSRKPKDEKTGGVTDCAIAAITRAGSRKKSDKGNPDFGNSFNERRLEGKTVTHKLVSEPKSREGKVLSRDVHSLRDEQRKRPILKKIWDQVSREGDCSKPHFVERVTKSPPFTIMANQEPTSESPEEPKVLATKVSGTVKWFNVKSGYGFINRHDPKEDVFVHRSAITKNNPRKYVRPVSNGDDVKFDVVVGEKGNQAANVTGPGGEAVKISPYAADHRRGYRRRYYRRAAPGEGEEVEAGGVMLPPVRGQCQGGYCSRGPRRFYHGHFSGRICGRGGRGGYNQRYMSYRGKEVMVAKKLWKVKECPCER